jgi:accessory gene regulator protein AgrB
MNIVIDCTLHNLLWNLIVLINYVQLNVQFNCTTFIVGSIRTAFIIFLVAIPLSWTFES